MSECGHTGSAVHPGGGETTGSGVPGPAAPGWMLTGLWLASLVLGALPVGCGQHRAVRRIFEARLRGLRPTPVRTRLRGGATMSLDISDYTQAQALLNRRYDPALVAFIRSRLPREGTFYDVGGHIGFVSLAVACARPDVSVVAFEPHPDNRERLEENVALNPGSRIEIEAAAAGSAAGTAMLSNDGEGTDFHRIVGRDATGSVEVVVHALDEVARDRGADRIDVLKLDVEGHEPEALVGASALLAAGRIGVVICELNDELLALAGSSAERLTLELKGLGYRREPIPPVGLHRFHAPSVPDQNWAFVRV